MADIAGTLALIGIALFVAIVLATVYVATSRYKLAPANKTHFVDEEQTVEKIFTTISKGDA